MVASWDLWIKVAGFDHAFEMAMPRVALPLYKSQRAMFAGDGAYDMSLGFTLLQPASALAWTLRQRAAHDAHRLPTYSAFRVSLQLLIEV